VSEGTINWTEDASAIYQQLADVAVPDREEQIASIVALLPFDREAAFRVVEAGSGEGYLSEVILACFPNASVLALDGSELMRSATAERLSRFGDRFSVEAFDIEDLTWVERADGADSLVSSLCVHHLRGNDKQRMFTNLANVLRTGGALIIADLVEPRHEVARQFLADTWDYETRRRSADRPGNDDGWKAFVEEEWNIYRVPDEMDRPSPLAEQLEWLASAGFDPVDCFWMKAGHAVYGGFLPGGSPDAQYVGFDRALAATLAAFETGTQ
jgi:tRNA (cmo5U34)-methyltransferase